MSTLGAADEPGRAVTPARRRHPHPGEGIPTFAWPTFAMFVGSLAVFTVIAVGTVKGIVPIWVTIPVSATISYLMFTVAHEVLHGAMSGNRWINAIVGRVAWAFVASMGSLAIFSQTHLEHHRNTNDGPNDPDMFTTHGPAWQMPFRWAVMDFSLGVWYLQRLPGRLRRSWRRPAAELAEVMVTISLSLAGLWAAAVTGNLWLVAVICIIPQRIGIFILAWLFDWLPHHGLHLTQRQDRYRASRVHLGLEWLATPILLAQNYHLMHHLHPWLPFYRLPVAWRRNDDAYVEHGAVVSTVLGRDLDPGEFRDWKQGNHALLPARDSR